MDTGFTNEDYAQLAEMLVILVFALGIIYILKKYIYPMIWRQFATHWKSPPPQHLSYKRFFLRVPLMLPVLGAIYYFAKETHDHHTADLILISGGLVIVFFPVYIFFHRTLKPFWASLPPTFTQHFQTSAPGSQPLRTASFRQRLEIAGIVILCVALLVLLGRLTGLYDQHQPVLFGVPVVDYITEFREVITRTVPLEKEDWLVWKQHFLMLSESLVELLLYTGLLVFVVFPIVRRVMLFVPSFNIRLTIVDHLGLLLACALGIGLGYLPALL